MESKFYNFLHAITKAKEKPIFSVNFLCQDLLSGQLSTSKMHGYYNIKVEHPTLNKSYIILNRKDYNRKLIWLLRRVKSLGPDDVGYIEIEHHTINESETIYGLPKRFPVEGNTKLLKGGLTLPLTLNFDGHEVTASSEYNCETITMSVHQLYMLVINNYIGRHEFEQVQEDLVLVEEVEPDNLDVLQTEIPINMLVNNKPFLYVPKKPQIFTVTQITDKITGFIIVEAEKVFIELPKLFITPALQTLTQLWVICEGDEPRILKILKEVNE